MQEKREQKGLSLWQIPEDLRAYGEGEILPRYANADPGHGPAHVRQVLANSRELLEGLEEIDSPYQWVVRGCLRAIDSFLEENQVVS